jgi:hypothetical protein
MKITATVIYKMNISLEISEEEWGILSSQDKRQKIFTYCGKI